MPRVSLLLALQIGTLLGFSLTAIKLFRIGLFRRYLFFSIFLIVHTASVSATMHVPRNSKAYFYLWLFAHPVYWVFYMLMVRELCGLMLEKYTGLKTLGRWFMYGSVAVAVIVSVASLIPGINPSITARSKAGLLGYVLSMDKGVNMSLAVFLLVLVALLSRYPVRLPRNVVVHAFLFTTFFLTEALTKLWVTMFGVGTFDRASFAIASVACACAYSWFFFLSKKGETVTARVAQMDSRREEVLLSQLNYLNQTLLKSSKS